MTRPDGRAKSVPVDISALAEGLGLEIVGSKSRGRFSLAQGKRAELIALARCIVVRSSLFDDQARENDVREVLAHEVAHFCAHLGFTMQIELPFPSDTAGHIKRGRLAFSRYGHGDFEREAIYLGALLQVPVFDLQTALRPAISEYRSGKWTLVSPALNGELELASAVQYREIAIEVVRTVFQTNDATAKVALDYWNALERPPKDWEGTRQEARRTSLR